VLAGGALSPGVISKGRNLSARVFSQPRLRYRSNPERAAPGGEPMVRGLAAGGKRLRTLGPAEHAWRPRRCRSRSRPNSPGGKSGRLEAVISAGTGSSTPVPSSGESFRLGLLATLMAFAAYKLTTVFGYRRLRAHVKDQGARPLLFLRVFGFGPRSSRLVEWQIGPDFCFPIVNERVSRDRL
jgi:hypothetical protein